MEKLDWNKAFEFTWRILVFIVAIGIIIVVSTNWTRWEGGAGWQRTNDAYLQADLTPISSKVAGYLRELPIQDFERGYTTVRCSRGWSTMTTERKLAAATAQIGVATADLYPRIRLVGLYGGIASELSQLTTNLGRTWGVGPPISWTFPNMAAPRARVREAKVGQAAALAAFDAVVLNALKETEQALAAYGAALDTRQSLGDAQARIHAAFGMAHHQFLAGAVSNLDLLTTEQSLVAIDTSVASSDAALILDQIALFKALGGGWRAESGTAR